MTLARVGHLETVIRVPDAASSLPGRLEELGRERLPGALTLSIERALPDAGGVVVLRHVDVGLLLDESAPTGAEEVADRWAEAAGAAVAAVADRGDVRDVVRFADEETFVAAFVRDLLAGRAWEMWCYGAFTHLRDLPRGAAVARVLEDHAQVLGSILRQLDRDGGLEPALSSLSPEQARSIWRGAVVHGAQPLDAASALPVAAAALAVATRMGLSGGAAPEPAQLAAGHSRWAPRGLDWTSQAELAEAVYGALVELVDSGLTTPAAPGLRQRVAAAVSELDWLDRERLVTRIVALLDPTDATGPPEQDVEAAALGRAIEAAALEIGPIGEESADEGRAALLLLAALGRREPELAARPQALAEIERMLARTPDGEPATSRPTTTVGEGAPERRPDWRRCEAAGVMLLARSLSDTRLAAVASRLELPAPGLGGDPAAALLLSLGLAVAGPAGLDGDQLDPALVALRGRENAITAAELAAAWSSTDASGHRRLRVELAELARGQRLDRARPVPDCCHAALPGLARGTAARAAHLVLMAWASWLRGLSGSTPRFLLAQLLRRGGSISVATEAVRVVLDPRPLDAAVELSGYFEPLARVPWLDGRTLYIERGQL